MDSFRISISAPELAGRMRERLRGAGVGRPLPQVAWRRDQQQVLLHLDSLVLRALDGWLVAGLDMQTDPTGRQTLQLIYHLGKDNQGDGLAAAATINTATVAAAQLAERWGADLHRVLWDAILDTLEAAIYHAGQQRPGQALTLQGYGCTNDQMFVDVLTGAS
jgi:hypothetical protein